MSKTTTRQIKPTLKVTTSSRLLNHSGSGILCSTPKSTKTRISRRSFTLTGESKSVDKSISQTFKHNVQVLDETGKDVTPRSLYQPEPGALQIKPNKFLIAPDTSMGTNSDFLSVAYQSTNASFTAPFTRSVFGSSSVSRSSFSTMESMSDEVEDPSSKRDGMISLPDSQTQKEEVKEQIREDQLDSVVHCYLTETETMCLIDIPPVSVSVDSDEADAVKERNNAYTELCKTRVGNDKYMERAIQTFNGVPKTKEVQSDSITMVEKGTMATNWDIYDSYVSDSERDQSVSTADGERVTVSDSTSIHRLDSTLSLDQAMSGDSVSSSPNSSSSQLELEVFAVQAEGEPGTELIMHSEKILKDLVVLERMVLQNIYQPKLAAYRGLPILQDPYNVQKEFEEAGKDNQNECPQSPALELLWTFSCELTVDRTVSCMAWNKKNPDLLAVGYGQFNFKDQKSGLVCGWSLKNPTWPGRIFHCESGVTALDFSACNASQLAVGMHDGGIAIYNMRCTERSADFSNSSCDLKHMGPVWQVKWIDHERSLLGADKGEALMSVSADGRISKWFLRKGLSCTDLMTLKRMRNEKRHERKRDPLISRLAPGLCFDFHHKDPNIYLAGTEEGHIHKCSCSYNEQFLETYTAHSGPVYKVTWSPFGPDIFLSCSADWTVQLWRQNLLTPVLAFTSTQTAVYDIMWSPHWATVFGVVHEDRVEIWDLGASILYPTIVRVASPGVKLSTLLFATNTNCVLVGDSSGKVSVYKLKNLAVGEGSQVDKLEDIIMSTMASKL